MKKLKGTLASITLLCLSFTFGCFTVVEPPNHQSSSDGLVSSEISTEISVEGSTQSSAESFIEDSSIEESSAESNSAAESSVKESFIESSVEESSAKESFIESSVEESSVKESFIESSVEESSVKESSTESSVEASSSEEVHQHTYELTKLDDVWTYACVGCDEATPLLSTEENGEFKEGLVDFAVEVEEGKDAVVLQISDTQFTYWGDPEGWCYTYLRETIEVTQPDLILVTGDNVYGRFDEDGEYLTSFIAFMESFQIPWAPVFGNHDNECVLGVDWQCEQYENAEYCLFEQRDLTGNGNYSVGLVQGNQLLRVFYMMDSNGCASPMVDREGTPTTPAAGTNKVKTTAGFGQDQVDWYTESITELKTFDEDVKISFAYHIPNVVFKDASEKYADDLSNGLNLDTFDGADETDFGYMPGKAYGTWDADYAIWEGMKALGVDSIFVGHDHTHSWSIVYEGVRLQFGQKSSEYDSFNFVFPQTGLIQGGGKDVKPDDANSLMGGTVIPVSQEDGSITKGYLYCAGDPFTYKPLSNVLQGDNRKDMPTYSGDVTELGFAEGTVVYELTNETLDNIWGDCWVARAILKAPATQDYVTLEFVTEQDIASGKIVFHTWGEKGSPSLYTVSPTTREGACITTMEGYDVTWLKAGTHYLLHVACAQLNEVQVGSLTAGSDIYFANIEFKNGVLPTPTTNPNPEEEPEPEVPVELGVYQGDALAPMPTYSGSATELGFPEGTETVYELVTNSADGWTPRAVIEVNNRKDYVKFDVVFSADIATNVKVWPAGNGTMYGSYDLSGSGVAPSSTADATRKVFILDENGEQATSLKANTLYTIYFYLTGQEESVHFGSWTDATLYFANIECADGDVGPAEPIVANIYTQNQAAPLPTYRGDVTELGFEEGTPVLSLTTADSTWTDAAYFVPAASTTCLTVNFSISTVFASGSQLRFYAWYSDANGWIAGVENCVPIYEGMVTLPKTIELLNADGTPVTAWEVGKVYTLKIYHEGASALTVHVDETTVDAGFTLYFDNNVVYNNDRQAHDHVYELAKRSGVWAYACTVCEEETSLLNDGLVDFLVEVEEGRDPVVLQLSDPQLCYWGDLEKWCYDYVSEVVEATSPDLIIITGDIVYGKFDEQGTLLTSFIAFMDSLRIPWAPVFGNHDNECILGVDWQCQQFENAEYCLFEQKDLTGNGNYSIGILQGNQLLRVFYMMDSNGCSSPMIDRDGNKTTAAAGTNVVKTTAGFGQDQIDWYTNSITELKTYDADVKISFAYHIQQAIFEKAFAKYEEYDKTLVAGSSSALANPLNIDTLEGADETDFGYIGRIMKGAWDTNYSVWNGMKALGVDSIFVGHEHCNSASIVYEGVRFQYGQKTSEYDRFNWILPDGTIQGDYREEKPDEANSLMGGTVIPISGEDGSIGIGYICYAGDPFTFKPVSNVLQASDRSDMPTYNGDVTELGFAAGTVVYEMVNATPENTYDDGWKTRTILKAPATQEYATFEFVLKEDIAEGAYVFHTWGVSGSPSLYQIKTNTTVGACITNMDGTKVASLKAGTHYLLYVLCEQLSEVQVGLISGGNTVYFANVTFGSGAFPGAAPVTPNPEPEPEPEPDEPLPDDVEIGGLAVTEAMLQANMGMSVGTTFDGEVGAYKVYAEKQGKILFDTALAAQSTTFTFTVFIPESSAGTSSFEFALRVKDKDGKNPLEGSDGKYIYYTPSVLPRGEWKTFTVDISVIGNDCTEFSLMLAAGTTMWIRDISFA